MNAGVVSALVNRLAVCVSELTSVVELTSASEFTPGFDLRVAGGIGTHIGNSANHRYPHSR